ncbi:beta-ketoacyl-[acyl-carrier-protein] synthase family protein [Streptomyces sp. S.PB5]|uniref:beta-ketoacyl-[acyl-carrier-protein] synthase family protein n=1 Tax=Streptomyces sp. S.PB5 TaxID=3020844 RepID=UPI0025B114C0|nr:beta-ketoacyl-[acyl-carrier-protein] synthase family protein [Streptomyces sp. S.PB5]MDN3020982.1 beta-ketoacyl-[acyl-carrier-protein] synthase family protein [Streptomyces sp. S.PB5]
MTGPGAGAGPEVAVTGIGLVTPGGTGREATWSRVVEGRPTAARDPELAGLRVDFACRVGDYDPGRAVPGGRPWQYDRHCQFALTAAGEAVADAGLDPDGWDGERVAVVVGTAFGGTTTQLAQHRTYLERGSALVSPLLVPMFLPNMAAGQVAIRLKARGPVLSTSTACASGATALGVAWDLVRSGACDIAVAGAADAAVHPLWVSGFDRMGALSRRTGEPGAASRPFDAGRDGFVMGEGAGVLVLERADRARARGRPGYALIAGYGASADAHHAVAPDPSGRGIELATRRALAAAGATPAEVAHINAHGTSTPLNDAAEAALITGRFPHRPSVTSAKGVLGHLLGAAGAVEAALTVLSLARETVPPVANLDSPGPGIDLDTVTKAARTQRILLALSNSFGFGGHNAVLAFRSAV